MYLDEVYELYSEHFAKFCMLAEINVKNHAFHGFYHESELIVNFHYYIRNQRIEIRKYGELEENRRIHLFGTAPLFA